VHRRFRPRKRFGQNFLHDPGIAQKILSAADIGEGQLVVELGAGKGFLTRPLADTGARLVALELDRDLYTALVPEFEASDHVDLINVDFTDVSLTSLLAERGVSRCVLIGNIPYHLTRDVLFSFLVDEHEVVDAAYLMMQKEVAQRIVAGPGSRTYGIPSVILQSLYEVKLLFKVAAGSFVPRPKIDSAVVEFKALDTPLVGGQEFKAFTTLVRSLFQQRRKTLAKSLRSFYALVETEVAQIERDTGIDLEKRPEALSKEEFLLLSRTLAGITS